MQDSMAYCKICGSTIEEFDKVCANCGTPVSKTGSMQSESPASSTKSTGSFADTDPVVGSWRFVGSLILLGLPVIGLVVAIVWAAGGVSNRNLRNLARANLLLLMIWTILLLSLLLTVLMKFGSILYFVNYLSGLFA